VRVLALDVGTSSVRAGVFDERGLPVEGVGAQTRYELPQGAGSKLDSEQLVDVVRAALEEARREAGGEVDAICAACFWHSLLPVDASGRALGPILTWQDTRQADAAARLARRLDPEAVHARTGCVLHPSFWPAKLAWLAETDPDTFANAARFLSFSDYLLVRLAGEGPTSLSMASGTGLLDVNEGCWDAELLDALRLEPSRLPAISDEPVEAGLPWFPALGDGGCSNVGAGCLTRNRAALMVGTSGAYRTVFEAETTVPRPGLFLYRLDGRRFVEGGSLSDGGNLYAWLEQTLRLPQATHAAASSPPDGHGLTFLALLGGERSPGWNARARGAVVGLRFETTAADLLQAALEGVAYRFAEIAELLPGVHDVVATGTALLADRPWIQIFADVLERPVSVSGVREGSLRGAAVVALERLGATPDPAPIAEIVQPRAERFEAYREARERARALYAAVT
jgi:gluconokinase